MMVTIAEVSTAQARVEILRSSQRRCDGIEQLKQLCLILQIRTGGIAKAEARTLVALTKQLIKTFASGGDAEFLSNVTCQYSPTLRRFLR